MALIPAAALFLVVGTLNWLMPLPDRFVEAVDSTLVISVEPEPGPEDAGSIIEPGLCLTPLKVRAFRSQSANIPEPLAVHADGYGIRFDLNEILSTH